MGTQCSRLCCRPCRKKQTTRQRVQNIYTFAPIQLTENYCKNKAIKISEYLKDRRSQVKHCVQAFKVIIQSIPYDFNAESERYIMITIYSLRSLCEYSKDFLPITYLLLYTLMKLPYFSEVKSAVYETLRITTIMYPDEDVNALGDIMTELVKYLSDPKNVSKSEIKFLSSISAPLHDRIVENSCFDWRNLVELILERILANSEVTDELVLLSTLSKLLLNISSIGENFLIYLINFFDKNKSWSHDSSKIFDSIIQGNKKYFIEKSSTVLKVFVDYLLEKKNKDTILIVECLDLIIANSEVINTSHYSSSWKKVVLNIMKDSSTSATQLLELWIFKADVISFFKLLKDVLLVRTTSAGKMVFAVCKKKIEFEFDKQCPNWFLQPMLELIYEVTQKLKEVNSEFLVKVNFI